MKKIIAGLMIAAAMFTFGCSGRNSDVSEDIEL